MTRKPRPKRKPTLPGFADVKRRRRRITSFDLPHSDPKPRVTQFGDVDATTTKARTK